MKLYFLVFSLAFNFFSCKENQTLSSPEDVLNKAARDLNNWETLSFNATSKIPNKPQLNTVYKIKKVGYEPHLKMFFFKEMNQSVSIYYKLASLAVVEDQKKKITTFDYDNDRSVPKYLEAYMSDDDNLLFIGELLSKFKNEFAYIEQKNVNGKKAYLYQLQDYKLWLDAKEGLPLKFVIEDSSSGKKEMVYKDIVFNEEMNEDTFTHPEKEGYVSSVFGIKKEPMLNVQAPNWTLLDMNNKKVSLEDFKGSPIFLETWVSSCDHCKASLPKVKQIEKEYGDKVKVVTVNFDYDIEETKSTIKTEDIHYQVLQGDATFDMDYDIQSFPSYFVINSAGIITHSGRGAIVNKKAEALIEALETVR